MKTSSYSFASLFLSPDTGGGGSAPLLSAASGAAPVSSAPAEGANDALASPPATDTPRGWVKPDGAWDDGVFDRLPPELQPAKATLGKYKSLPEFIKGHMHLQQHLGKAATAVMVPDERATPEELATYRHAIGVPESPDAYQIRPEQLPDGLQWNDDLAKPYAAIAHRHNVPEAAMRELVAENVRQQGLHNRAAAGLMDERLQEGQRALRSTFGADYDKKISLATRAAQVAGLDVKSSGLCDPQVVVALSRLGAMLSEDKLVGPGGTTRHELAGKSLARDIQTNTDNPRYQKYQDGDAETVSYVRNLLRNG